MATNEKFELNNGEFFSQFPLLISNNSILIQKMNIKYQNHKMQPRQAQMGLWFLCDRTHH